MADQNIVGGRELDEMLRTLPVKIERNILRGALRQGANVIKDEAKANLAASGSVVSGELSRGLKVSTRSKGGSVYASLKAKGKHAHIAHWIEFGVKPHGVKKGAKRASGKLQNGVLHPGFGDRPFMRPALDNRSAAAVAAVTSYIRARLTAEGINAPAPEGG